MSSTCIAMRPTGRPCRTICCLRGSGKGSIQADHSLCLSLFNWETPEQAQQLLQATAGIRQPLLRLLNRFSTTSPCNLHAIPVQLPAGVRHLKTASFRRGVASHNWEGRLEEENVPCSHRSITRSFPGNSCLQVASVRSRTGEEVCRPLYPGVSIYGMERPLTALALRH